MKPYTCSKASGDLLGGGGVDTKRATMSAAVVGEGVP